MNFLLTNDDGIDAPGLSALRSAVDGLGRLMVVAPVGAQSGCSHTVTTGQSVRIDDRPLGFAIHGTPADCVRVGLHHLSPDSTWVLSGVNHGGNLGADVFYSGTVAAVREGALHGRPGIAFSHYMKRHLEYDWPRVSRWVNQVILDLLGRPIEPGSFWNVNVPHLAPDDAEPAIIHCPVDTCPLPLHFEHDAEGLRYAGDYHNRQRNSGSDVDVCFNGNIAVSLMRLS